MSLTAIVLGITSGSNTGLIGLLVVWLALTAINIAYAVHSRPEQGQRGQPGQSGWR